MQTESQSVRKTERGRALLQRIGDALDRNEQLIAFEGGSVWPATEISTTNQPGILKEVITDARQPETSPSGSPAGSWEGPTGSRAPEGATASNSAASIIRELNLPVHLHSDLLGAVGAYPQMRVRRAQEGIWLTGTIRPVDGVADAALLLVLYPLNENELVRAWAWWDVGVWIGPRHTNFEDGSICAFEVKDGTWDRRKSLATYLDFVSLWIVRQMYFRRFGRWPGRQVLHTAYERLSEHRPGEMCGGCQSGRFYEECCRSGDLRRARADVEREFRKIRQLGSHDPIAERRPVQPAGAHGSNEGGDKPLPRQR